MAEVSLTNKRHAELDESIQLKGPFKKKELC